MTIQFLPVARPHDDKFRAVVEATQTGATSGKQWDINVPNGVKNTREEALVAAGQYADHLRKLPEYQVPGPSV